ncbi:hypothetical protein [Chromobacterium sp. Beijing]|uniref:hypothetical protein n=1 Tax=Chromobacterium sp. Beijing TaxID=2735795 RepID=UPI001F1AF73D|nr:hypothetical protein [Chromobacterium sp. Beijing]UJB33739.1 hypothetical protein HQN78_23345 [Chromobacterium sp. Beijing]
MSQLCFDAKKISAVGSPKEAQESMFEFLERCPDARFDSARNSLIELFNRYPESEKAEMLTRIMARNDRQFKSAVFELFLYGALSGQGFTLEPHPLLSNGSEKKPDFLVTAPSGESFYLEAVLAGVDGDVDPIKLEMVSQFVNRLKKQHHEQFSLFLLVKKLPSRQPSANKLMAFIRDWFCSLVNKGVTEEGAVLGEIDYKDGDFEVELTATSKKNEGLINGWRVDGARFVKPAFPVTKALKAKAAKYGELDRPFVIAVNSDWSCFDGVQAEAALYGSLQASFFVGEEDINVSRKPDGFWSEGHYSRVSAVWLFASLDVFTLNTSRHGFYTNEHADFVLNEGVVAARSSVGR